MTDRFEDERGIIQDMFDGEPVNVTRITTAKGCVRGNHIHRRTMQWTLVLRGCLRVRSGGVDRIVNAGRMVKHPPGDPHAWKAFEDSECLVFTRGPRAADYEKDTYMLEEPLL